MGQDPRAPKTDERDRDGRVSTEEFTTLLDELGVDEVPEPEEDGEYFEKRWVPEKPAAPLKR
jgi:hypothetical protein